MRNGAPGVDAERRGAERAQRFGDLGLGLRHAVDAERVGGLRAGGQELHRADAILTDGGEKVMRAVAARGTALGDLPAQLGAVGEQVFEHRVDLLTGARPRPEGQAARDREGVVPAKPVRGIFEARAGGGAIAIVPRQPPLM